MRETWEFRCRQELKGSRGEESLGVVSHRVRLHDWPGTPHAHNAPQCVVLCPLMLLISVHEGWDKKITPDRIQSSWIMFEARPWL